MPALAKLPERCISREPTTGRLVMLQRGRQGFQYISGERAPQAYNRALGLSYEQVEAMEYGALFGFDAELADPDCGGPDRCRGAAAQPPGLSSAFGSDAAGRHRQFRALVSGGAGARAQAMSRRS